MKSNSVLTDEEIEDLYFAEFDNRELSFIRSIESAVLEKLKQQEPVAWNYELENDAFRRAYTLGFKADTPLYATPMPADGVEKQRDELLAALEQCRFALEPYDDIKPRDWKTDREKLAFAHQAASVAITVVKGEKE